VGIEEQETGNRSNTMAKIITSDSEVPEGWVRIADMTDNSTDAKILSEASVADEIPAVKRIRTSSEVKTGPVWVEPVAAEKLLQRYKARRMLDASTDGARRAGASAVEERECNHGVLDALNRIAAALEAIATNPGNK
jgi:hypothetical protein